MDDEELSRWYARWGRNCYIIYGGKPMRVYPRIQARLFHKGWRWNMDREQYELPCGMCRDRRLASVVIEPEEYGTIGSFFTDLHARWVRFWLTH